MELNLQIKLTPEQLESILNAHFYQKGYDVQSVTFKVEQQYSYRDEPLTPMLTSVLIDVKERTPIDHSTFPGYK